MIRFECGNCGSVNVITEQPYHLGPSRFESGMFQVAGTTFAWCRVCGVVQKVNESSALSEQEHTCPACAVKRLHTDEERKAFHPHSGEGFDLLSQPKRGRPEEDDV